MTTIDELSEELKAKREYHLIKWYKLLELIKKIDMPGRSFPDKQLMDEIKKAKYESSQSRMEYDKAFFRYLKVFEEL